jgi:hypothetical protein
LGGRGSAENLLFAAKGLTIRLMIWPRIWSGALAAGALALTQAPAAATDALILPTGPVTDVAVMESGGAGWSFVPTTNLLLTAVGYLNTTGVGGDPNAVVSIWAGTNALLASYTGITNAFTPAGEIISAGVAPLALTAGQTYTIAVYTAPLATVLWSGYLHDNTGWIVNAPFAVAAQLSQYQAWLLNTDGTFTPFEDSPLNQQILWLGPTFTYRIGVLGPTLTIGRSGSNGVQLSWPTNAAGFVLQSSSWVQGAYTTMTNLPVLTGTNYSTTLPATNAAAFYRLVKPS